MAAELDPLFVRALHLLHSRHPKSLEQLCALRDEVLGKKVDSPVETKKDVLDLQHEKSDFQSIGQVPELTKIDQVDGKIVQKDSPCSSSSSHSSTSSDITETIEVESSSLSSKGLISVDDDIVETVEEFGSSFLETLEELGSSDLLSKTKKPKLDLSISKTTIEQVDLASRESSPDREISSDLGIHCIICLSGKNSMLGNQMVECHECHEHYHQTCHKPSITDQNINDPRHVWYCSSCVKKMKEVTSTSTTTKPKLVISPSYKSLTQSFKPPVRVDGKPPSFSPGSSSINQSFNIPSLTGNNSSNNLKSPTNANPRDATRNSMKRLQMVKKKAAAKNQQRFMKK